MMFYYGSPEPLGTESVRVYAHHWYDTKGDVRSGSLPTGFPATVAKNPRQYLPGWGTGASPEGTLLNQVEGTTSLQQVGGWAVLAFWDRSGQDARDGSCSVFAALGAHTFAEMVAEILSQFGATFANPIVADVGGSFVMRDSTPLSPPT